MAQEFWFYQNEVMYCHLIAAMLLKGAPQNMREVSLGGTILSIFYLVNGERESLNQ